MASSTNNDGNPWQDRQGRARYFKAKYGTGPRNQNANMHPPYGQQQQWPPYQQQPYAAPVTYVTTVYGGYPTPPGHYPFNQWNPGYQYMPPMPSMPGPYPTAYNSSWGQSAAFNPPGGQPAPRMPNQQGPPTGNRARQRAPPRQPTPGFVSEENENAASSSSNGVGSMPKEPGTSQTPPETSENTVASEVAPGLEVVQRPKTPMNTVASDVIPVLEAAQRPKTPTNTVASDVIPTSEIAQRPKTPENAVASEGTPALEMAQRPETATDTTASKANQSPTMTERPKMFTDPVISISPQASKLTQRPRMSRLPTIRVSR